MLELPRSSTAACQMVVTQVRSSLHSLLPASNNNLTFYSHDQSESMVSKRRSGVYYHMLLYGTRNDTRHRISVLRPRPSEVRPLYDLGGDGIVLSRDDSVVLLGLLTCVLNERHIWIYRESGTLRVDEDSG